MTRMFREGRTETVRSCTVQTANFVKAMEKGNTPVAELQALLKEATANHVKLYQAAMMGKGVDRHLFTPTWSAGISG